MKPDFRKWAALVLLAGSLAWGQELVEVKEAPPTVVQSLKSLDAELETATKELAAMQKLVLDVKARKAEVERAAFSKLNPYEGACVTRQPESHNGITFAVGYLPVRTYRRVTISGKFFLVHAGTEPCGNGSYWTTGSGGSTALEAR